jgi:GntR family transcriptional repressor for pyruvate dehydrogenase complex
VGVEVSDLDQYAFNNIQRTSTAERIIENLISLIKKKSLKIGDKLPAERELCKMIGVSRPILREALKALQVMNIIGIRQGAGAYVKSLEPKDVVEHLDIVFHLDESLYHDLYEARRVLEGSVARTAALKITDEEIEKIEESIRQAAAGMDDEQVFFQKDLELHEMILKAAGNRVLPIFMQSINKLSLIMREKTNARPDIRKGVIRDHELILEALKKRDPGRTAAAMEQHIANVENAFFQIKGSTK